MESLNRIPNRNSLNVLIPFMMPSTRPQNRLLILLPLLALLLVPVVTSAQLQELGIPNRPTGHVNDLADMLSRQEQVQLERKLRNYRDTTTNVLAILTIEELKGYSEDEIAVKTFNTWEMWHSTEIGRASCRERVYTKV